MPLNVLRATESPMHPSQRASTVLGVSDLAAAEARYESCELAYLNGIRRSAHNDLVGLAADVAAAASSWNSTAYARLHASTADGRRDLDYLTEQTEVLSELWADIHSAHVAAQETPRG
jgi:hypothetical protein